MRLLKLKDHLDGFSPTVLHVPGRQLNDDDERLSRELDLSFALVTTGAQGERAHPRLDDGLSERSQSVSGRTDSELASAWHHTSRFCSPSLPHVTEH